MNNNLSFALALLKGLKQLKKFSDKTIVKLEAVVALPLFIICLAHCVGNGYNPFIYFNF